MLITRRTMLKRAAALAGMGVLGGGCALSGSEQTPRFKIGACDWSIQRRADIRAFEMAKRIGLDGVQVSLNTVDDPLHLRSEALQRQYRRAAEAHGVAIGGLALGVLNRVPYKSDPRAEQWVRDSIDVAEALGTEVVLLAFFGAGDIKDDAEGRRVVARRLREVAPKAEKAGVVLGIESWLSAEEHVALIEAVGSPNVRVYYDVANSHKRGYDIYEEIRRLGSEYICEFHAKEYGYRLGQGPIDFRRVRAAIEEIRYDGWLQIEAAVPEGTEMFESYVANARFLRSIFSERK